MKRSHRQRRQRRPGSPRLRYRASLAGLGLTALSAIVLAFVWYVGRERPVQIDRILAGHHEGARPDGLTIRYPLDGTLFPPDVVAPEFRWEDNRRECNLWLVVIDFSDGSERMSFPCVAPEWTPSADDWEAIKRHSLEKQASVTILGVNRARQKDALSTASITFSTSEDEVGAPIFYREVSLPFRTAVLDPAKHVRWRFGAISSPQTPPIVLEKLPVCGNCHSFSADGKTLAMEVDSGADKASYAVLPVEEEMTIDQSKVITWADYQRDDRQVTFGLLCQISPDGRYVVGTVKDRALAVHRPELTFSQLFFLIKGYLAIYDRQKREYHALPGADDPRRVHTNGTWSPDGKHIVFARSRDPALDPPELRYIKSVMVPAEAADDFVSKGKTFLYDLYRIPFNEGRGGTPEPLAGASDNGTSNYFPKYSPDGKWIVFCRARSFMLLQPDSELYIVPAEGGEARRLRCNTPRMNSWHSWSPNGKWLVFSSKVNTSYTQLFLTHIDEAGNSTPPVLLQHFNSSDRAANIPEFVNARPDAIRKIRERLLGEETYLRLGGSSAFYGEYGLAIRRFKKALAFRPNSAEALTNWGAALARQYKLDEAREKFSGALALEPDHQGAHFELAMVLGKLRLIPDAARHYREAIRLDPTAAQPHLHLGSLLVDVGEFDEGIEHLTEAARLDPKDTQAHVWLGTAMARGGRADEAADSFRRALKIDPECVPALLQLASLLSTSENQGPGSREEAVTLATRACELTHQQDATALLTLSSVCEEVGRTADALSAAENALRLAHDAGDERLIDAIRERFARLTSPAP